MDVLVELFVATVVALAAAAFAHFGVPFGEADSADVRSVRRSTVAVSTPAPERVIIRVSEECDEDKIDAAVVGDAVETATDGQRIDTAIDTAIETALVQAERDVAAAVDAAGKAQAWAEREAARAEALAERAEALAERRAEQAAG